ncbi:MAG: hypothetical protein ACMUIA_05630 [bacterium]
MVISRTNLSWNEKLRRSLYVTIRDELDADLMEYALIDSYRNFAGHHHPYPFVEKRELKPRARTPDREYEYQNSFLVLFCEGTIPDMYKRYIRFFDSTRVTKENLLSNLGFTIFDDFFLNIKYFESPQFKRLLSALLPVDYALLIQRDASTKAKNRYVLSHFHVKIDWPVSDAAEDLGRELRYLTNELYERGESHAESLQEKLFEYYGFYHSVGGRRTAAVVAAQFLRRMNFCFAVYVSSSAARHLTKITERDISRYLLVRLKNQDMQKLARMNHMRFKTFQNHFIIHKEKEYGVGILLVVYEHTAHSKPPADGRIRPLNPDYRWLAVAHQFLMPRPSVKDTRPINYRMIYTT